MATRGLGAQMGGGGGGGRGKIEGRHILIIAMSEHHVDSPMCTSDSMDSCMAPGFLQTMISIAKVRKRYCSEIESCKSKPIDQKFQLFCMATRHSR